MVLFGKPSEITRIMRNVIQVFFQLSIFLTLLSIFLTLFGLKWKKMIKQTIVQSRDNR